jgi:kumamolisin
MRDRVMLAASRRLKPKDRVTGTPDPDKRITVGFYLKDPTERPCRPGSADDFAALEKVGTREELAELRRTQYAEGARLVELFARQHGLEVAEIDFAKRRVRLSGTIGQMAKAFATKFVSCRSARRECHTHVEPVHISEPLTPWTRGVLGLDTRPRIRPRLRSFAVNAANSQAKALWPADMARLYGIGAPARGAGQCIGIIAPSGGYLPDDLALAAQHIGAAFPAVVDVSVDLGRNKFGGGTLADQELALDLQVAGAVAPAARLVVYFTDNSEQGLADAVLAAVHDDVHRPNAISISWGAAELEWSAYQQAQDILSDALADSVTLGVVVTAATGDALATDAVDDDLVHVNFPASSPYVLACGGSSIELAADGNSISSEVVWNDGNRGTGGGISDVFDIPQYQQGLVIPASVSTGKSGRGIPDVTAAAAERNGYNIFVNRKPMVQGGTSAVAPLWAAFVALINAERGAAMRRIHPVLYGDAALFRSVTGNNKTGTLGYEAVGPGWNACAGLGAPLGGAILAKATAVS